MARRVREKRVEEGVESVREGEGWRRGLVDPWSPTQRKTSFLVTKRCRTLSL